MGEPKNTARKMNDQDIQKLAAAYEGKNRISYPDDDYFSYINISARVI